MKKFNFLVFFMAIGLAAISFSACEREVVMSYPTVKISNVELLVKDGRVIVKKLLDLQSLYKYEMNNGKLFKTKMEDVVNFVSSEKAFESIDFTKVTDDLDGFSDYAYFYIDQNGDKYLDPIISDPVIRHLANQKGIIQIEDKVYKILRNEVQYVSESIFDKYGFGKSEYVKNSSIDRYVYFLNVENELESRFRLDDCQTNYNGGNNRVRGILEGNRSFFAGGAMVAYRVETKNYRRNGWFWGSGSADEISLNGSFSIVGQGTFNANAIDFDTNYVGNTFFYGSDLTQNVLSGSCDHTASRGGDSGFCSTQR